MKKLSASFALIGSLAFLAACGPSAEELAQKEKMRQDSIRQVQVADSLAAVEMARQDSIAKAEQARQDSIAAAEALASERTKAGTPKSNKPKEPAKTAEEKTKETMSSRKGNTAPSTPQEKKAQEETIKKMEGRRK